MFRVTSVGTGDRAPDCARRDSVAVAGTDSLSFGSAGDSARVPGRTQRFLAEGAPGSSSLLSLLAAAAAAADVGDVFDVSASVLCC